MKGMTQTVYETQWMPFSYITKKQHNNKAKNSAYKLYKKLMTNNCRYCRI